jgi:Na+-transporting methylmalonyl-CoA/oxaloacetate decarboxylase gamma subunit
MPCELDSRPVDPFAIVLLAVLAILVLWVWILGRANQGRSMEPFGLRSARQITEAREELEAEDLAQMLEAHNARRRRRGEDEMTVADLERRVMQDVSEQRRRREAYLADRELEELLEATNARRRARGLPDRTREEVQREYGPGAAGER